MKTSAPALALVSLTMAMMGWMASCAGELQDPERFGSAGTAGCVDVVTVLFPQKCGTTACHNPTDHQAGLDLVSPGVDARVNGVVSTSDDCPGQTIADPSDPEGSLLLSKLSDTPPCGARMPFATTPLSAVETDCIREWVAGLTPGMATGGGMAGMGGMGGSAGGMGGAGGAGGAGGM
jgi:hypothetical protein